MTATDTPIETASPATTWSSFDTPYTQASPVAPSEQAAPPVQPAAFAQPTQTVVPPVQTQTTSAYNTRTAQPQPPRYAPYGAPSNSTQGRAYNNTTAYVPQPPKKKKSGSTVAIILLSVLCCASLIFSAFMASQVLLSDKPQSGKDSENPPSVSDSDSQNGTSNGPTLQITDAEAINDGGLATSEIVDRNLDATVVLTMYTKSMGSFYGYYFDDGSDSLTEAGGASGIIMSEDGYIITNSHCVFDEESQAEFDRIDVTLYDGRVFEGAKIIGYDPTTDLAVIKIDATGLTPAQFGDSSALSLGDRVITLGNSGGLQWSVSQGILSGQARDVYEDTGYAIKCLQVDAVINPGSSGGPLINAYGQVVGVNSAKIVLTGYEGLGFSIPINEAKEVIDDLIQHGYVTGRVSLGIMGRTITSIGYEGFMIESINKDSALVGTKAQAGDIITHVNGKRVTDYAEMRAELTAHKVGETITLSLLRLDRQTRQTTEFDITVVLQESR